MSKIMKTMAGVMLVVSMLVSSAMPCYAVQNSIKLNLTATNLYGLFEYYEAGHQLKITVYYKEKNNSTGQITGMKSVGDTRNGNVTDVAVTKSNTSGYSFTWGQAFGYVDGAVTVTSAEISL